MKKEFKIVPMGMWLGVMLGDKLVARVPSASAVEKVIAKGA